MKTCDLTEKMVGREKLIKAGSSISLFAALHILSNGLTLSPGTDLAQLPGWVYLLGELGSGVSGWGKNPQCFGTGQLACSCLVQHVAGEESHAMSFQTLAGQA